MPTDNTFVQIGSTVTVGAGGAASIEFTSIPATYTDLTIQCSLRGNRTASENQAAAIEFNSSTSNLSAKWIRLLENGLGGNSEASSIPFGVPGAANTASIFNSTGIYIPNYAGSTYKSVSIESLSENNGTNVFSYMTGGLWSNTAAITSGKIIAQNAGTSFVQYSTASLYGILKY